MTIEIEGFIVDREIGRGGFGVVYHATQVAFNRPVAIKVLHAGMSAADLQKRFAHECRAVGSLRSHPNILSVYSTGVTTDGSPYLAMALLTGGSLSERVPLPPDAVAALGVRLANALQLAHAGGVIHRDVKPANVLFNDDDEPVLVDFGISSLVGEASTRSGNVAISIGYTPPEVLDGAHPGVAADIYALGATLFAAVTGRTPFVQEGGFSSIAVMAARIFSHPVEDLRPLGVPDALCTVIETAMAKDPEERYASMTAMRAALEPLSDDTTIRSPHSLWGPAPEPAQLEVTRPTRGRRVAAGVRSHRAVSVAAAVALVAGASFGAAALASSTTSGEPRAGATVSDSRSASPPSGSGSGTSSPSTTASRSPKPRVIDSLHPHVTTKTSVAPGGQTIVVTQTSYPLLPVAAIPGPSVHSIGKATVKPVTIPDRAPSVTVSSARTTFNEHDSVDVSFGYSDPDKGDRVSLRESGSLPYPLTFNASTHTISGQISADAVKFRTSYTQAATPENFAFTVTATDSHNRSTARRLTWTVLDTYLTMPNYIGYAGDGVNGPPNIGTTFPHRFDCVYEPDYTDSTVWRQSIRNGTAIKWGTTVHFWYVSHLTYDPDSGDSCVDVSRGYGP